MGSLNAKDTAETWAEQHLPASLRGKILHLVDLESDENARFFYPGRNWEFHKMVNTRIGRIARTRGAKTWHVEVTPEDYQIWLRTSQNEDSREARQHYITSCYQITDRPN